MIPSKVLNSQDITLTSGQFLLIQVVNSDGTIATILYNESIPLNFSFNGSIVYQGDLVSL